MYQGTLHLKSLDLVLECSCFLVDLMLYVILFSSQFFYICGRNSRNIWRNPRVSTGQVCIKITVILYVFVCPSICQFVVLSLKFT